MKTNFLLRRRITPEMEREVNRLLWKEKLTYDQIRARTGISVRSISAITGGGRKAVYKLP